MCFHIFYFRFTERSISVLSIEDTWFSAIWVTLPPTGGYGYWQKKRTSAWYTLPTPMPQLFASVLGSIFFIKICNYFTSYFLEDYYFFSLQSFLFNKDMTQVLKRPYGMSTKLPCSLQMPCGIITPFSSTDLHGKRQKQKETSDASVDGMHMYTLHALFLADQSEEAPSCYCSSS